MNPYSDRFLTEDGAHTTIPGAIPKSQRAYTAAHFSSSPTNRLDYSSYRSQAEDAILQDKERQRQAPHGGDGDGVGEGGHDDEFDYDGRSPWEHANGIMGVQEENEAAWKRTGTRDMNRRFLQDSGAEPAVESPLSCVSQGDSVLFDISSGCYPVYQKDSLLNSNLE